MLNRDSKGRFIKKEQISDNKQEEDYIPTYSYYSYKKINDNTPEIMGKKIILSEKDGKIKEEIDLSKEAEEYFKTFNTEEILSDMCPGFNSFKGIDWNPFDIRSNWHKLLN